MKAKEVEFYGFTAKLLEARVGIGTTAGIEAA